MNIFEKLPIELIGRVLSYDGVWKLRNGVFMKQIAKNRYDFFHRIPKPRVNVTRRSTFIYIDFKQSVTDENWFQPVLLPTRSMVITHIHYFNCNKFLYQYSKLLHDELLEGKDWLTYVVS